MSTFVCPHCGETTDIFKKDGGKKTAELLGTAFLGAIPLDPKIVLGGDAGVPIVGRRARTGRTPRPSARWPPSGGGRRSRGRTRSKPKLSIV